jgi:phosphoribosylformylglycinamidine synthase
MVGVVDDVTRSCGMAFRGEGDLIVLVAGSPPAIQGSAYLQVLHGLAAGRPEDVDLARHRRVLSLVRGAVRRGLLSSAHDCADGGAAVAIAESAIAGRIGVQATLPTGDRNDTALFGEGPSRFILSLPEDAAGAVFALAGEWEVPLVVLGHTGGERVRLRASGDAGGIPGDRVWDVDVSLDELDRAYNALSEVFA